MTRRKVEKRKRSGFATIVEDVFKKHGESEDTREFTFVNAPTRKEKRKEIRLNKKKRKAGIKIKIDDVKTTTQEDAKQKKAAKTPTKTKNNEKLIEKVKKQTNFSDEDEETIEIQMERFKKSAEKVRIKRLAEDNSLEDRTISQLEKKLHLRKSKSKGLPASFKADGFDYILNLIDDVQEEKKEDFFQTKGKKKISEKKKELDSGDEGEEMDVSEEEDGFFMDEDVPSGSENDEIQSGSENDDEFEDDAGENDNEDKQKKEEKLTNKPANESPEKPVSKYIPPALRNNNEKEFLKLQRQLKGLLNRVSDANLNKVSNDIESMYRENSRAIMNEVFSGLIMSTMFQPDPIPDKLSMEIAMLICTVSRRIAIEVLAYVLEDVVCKFYEFYISKNHENDKSINNAVALISNLYRLKITHASLPIDFLKLFSESFAEKNVELILQLLQMVGFQLRQDDPSSFKDIVQQIVSKSGEIDQTEGTRMTFMLDTLTAIKNNNARKLTQYYDPEMVKQCRKKVQIVVGSASSALEKLPAVAMDDFLHGDTNGRWWVVGSAWAGAPMLKQEEKQENSETLSDKISSKLVEAARKQRMNTDLRRSVFYAIMTAEDYVNACEKILALGLKDKQVQEIPHVILECCQQGRTYNAFYCHLLSKFCAFDRQYVLGIQCSFWDRFKLLNELKKRQISNLSKLLSQLILNHSIPLSVLKNIEFTQLDDTMVSFLRNFFREFAADNECVQISSKVAANKKFRPVSQGLILFLQHFVLNEDNFENECLEYKSRINSLINTFKSSSKMSVFSL